MTEYEGVQLLPRDAPGGCQALVLGDMGDHWDYSTLNQAFRLLMRPAAQGSGDSGEAGTSGADSSSASSSGSTSASASGASSSGSTSTSGRGSTGAPGPPVLISLGKSR